MTGPAAPPPDTPGPDTPGPIVAGSTRRAMGIETEFGVHAPDGGSFGGNRSAMVLSHYAVAAYALLGEDVDRRVRWDYGDETPLRDARGFELERAAAHPSQLTHQGPDAGQPAHVPPAPSVDLDEPVHASETVPEGSTPGETLRWAASRAIGNAVLRNGARLYVDHAHPEYSAPEVMTAREALVWDKAGERIAAIAMERLHGADGVPEIVLYKNNTDGKGASYGTHENYLVDRELPFDRLAAGLIPFFVTRPVVVGAGRVGIGRHGEKPGFQLSSRADFLENDIGLETTLNRPIVNTRDEPHADPARHRRLHVIVGDANLLEVAGYLKLGMTSLVLSLLESGAQLPVPALADPVAEAHAVSHDTTLTHRLRCVDGTERTALEILAAYHDAVAAHVEYTAREIGRPIDAETADVLARWGDLIERLGADPSSCHREVEWVAKLRLLTAYRDREQLAWDDPRLAMIDLQFTDLRPDRSLYRRLATTGAAERIATDEEIERAVTVAPASTRAHLRGHLAASHRDRVPAAGWESITLTGAGGAVRLRLADPEAGSAAWCARHGLPPDPDPDAVIAACGKDL